MSRAWSFKDDDKLRDGKRPKGRSDASIRRRRERLGLAKTRQPVDDARVAQLVTEGLSSWAISAALGIGYHAVLGARARLGLKAPVGRPGHAPRVEPDCAPTLKTYVLGAEISAYPQRVRIMEGPPDLVGREGTLTQRPDGGLQMVLDTASAGHVTISTANLLLPMDTRVRVVSGPLDMRGAEGVLFEFCGGAALALDGGGSMDRARPHAPRLRQLLEDIQWSMGDETHGWCPKCERHNVEGHADDCALDAELQLARMDEQGAMPTTPAAPLAPHATKG